MWQSFKKIIGRNHRFVSSSLVASAYRFGAAMEALSRKTEKEKLVELEEMLADATTLTGVCV